MPCSYDGPTCRASGDPHYRTFDRYWHHFQGICEYVLTKQCSGDDYVISASNAPCGRRRRQVSCVESVRVNVTSENLEILLQRGGRGTVTINGMLQPNTGNGIIYESNTVDVIRCGGSPYVFLKTYGLRITFNGRTRARITTSTQNFGELCGLCGTYDNDRNDDLQKPDGTLASSVNEFGNCWLIPDPTNPDCDGTEGITKRNAPDIEGCSNDTAVVLEGEMRCAVMRLDPFTPCNSIVDPSEYIADCEFDYCCTNETEREDYYCDILSSYASACADAGVPRSTWRSPSLCRKSMEWIG